MRKLSFIKGRGLTKDEAEYAVELGIKHPQYSSNQRWWVACFYTPLSKSIFADEGRATIKDYRPKQDFERKRF